MWVYLNRKNMVVYFIWKNIQILENGSIGLLKAPLPYAKIIPLDQVDC
jgi:hypothetical protein